MLIPLHKDNIRNAERTKHILIGIDIHEDGEVKDVRKTADSQTHGGTERFTFRYRTRTRIHLIIVTALLLLLVPVTALDQNAWIGGLPILTVVLVVAVVYFASVILLETNKTVTLGRSALISVSGFGKWRRTVEIPYDRIAQLRDDTTLFSLGRKYSVIGEDRRIRLNGALGEYNRLLKLIVSRIPRDRIDERAVRSLKRSGILR